MPKPISVQLYSVREKASKDFPSVLKRIADMGYVGVEPAGLHGMSASDVCSIVKDLGLLVSSAHVPMPTKDNIGELARDAEILGYRHLVSGFGPDQMKTAESIQECVDKFAHACDVAQAQGLTMGMHNHEWEFDHLVDGQTPYDTILKNAPDLKSELDVYWCALAGPSVPDVITQWKDRIPLLHIKDGELGTERVHTAVGKGKLDMAPIVSAADDTVLEWIVVELDACATDMMEAVAESCRYLVDSELAAGRE